MQCVIPLAGPQLTHPKHGLIAKLPVDGVPLLRRALETRPWAARLAPRDLVFVLRDGPEVAELHAAVTGWYAGCRVVRLSHLSGGAVLSALAGAALAELDEPLIVDLADILYEADGDIAAMFAAGVGAVVPCFEASDPCYSYLALAADGSVASAAEKKVISNLASAGTYVFRSAAHFMAAAGRALLERRDELAVAGALFVCPVVNTVVRQGLRVLPLRVGKVRPLSKALHAA